jgi:hypothetical protein
MMDLNILYKYPFFFFIVFSLLMSFNYGQITTTSSGGLKYFLTRLGNL